MPNKLLLVLDTWVIASVAKFGPEWADSLEVLTRILNNCHSIVLDYENKVETEYRPYLDKEKFLRKWFSEMMSKGKIKLRGLTKLSLQLYITDDDKKFVELVVNTPDHILISGDSDFVANRGHLDFTSRAIRIINVQECKNHL